MDEAHLKAGMKALARLHAMSYAYFNKGENNVKEFSEVDIRYLALRSICQLLCTDPASDGGP